MRESLPFFSLCLSPASLRNSLSSASLPFASLRYSSLFLIPSFLPCPVLSFFLMLYTSACFEEVSQILRDLQRVVVVVDSRNRSLVNQLHDSAKENLIREETRKGKDFVFCFFFLLLFSSYSCFFLFFWLLSSSLLLLLWLLLASLPAQSNSALKRI